MRQAPSAAYLFGADELGRDVLSASSGARAPRSSPGVVSVSISMALGVPIGMLAGYLGRWVDAIISRINDAMLACPFLILAIALAAFLGPSLTNAMIAIASPPHRSYIRLTARSARREAEDYVEAARALGNPHWRIGLPPTSSRTSSRRHRPGNARHRRGGDRRGQPLVPGFRSASRGAELGSCSTRRGQLRRQAPWMAIWQGFPSSCWLLDALQPGLGRAAEASYFVAQ